VPKNHGDILKHVPNSFVALRLCDECKDTDEQDCAEYGPMRRRVFMCDDCFNSFGQWLFSKENRGAVAIAHNAKGFDAQFVLNYIHEQKTITPKVVADGLELMMVEGAGVRVIDSLNFLSMPLSAMPKAFGVTEMKKGYFPYLWNTSENWTYNGAWPDAEYYGPDTMKTEKREEFLKWQLDSGKRFKLQDELLSYCSYWQNEP